MRKKVWLAGIGLVGLALTVLAVLAQRLGIGHSSHWGVGRKIVLLAGLLLLAISLLVLAWTGLARLGRRWMASAPVNFVRRAIRNALGAVAAAWRRWPPAGWLAEHIGLPLRQAGAHLRRTRLVRAFADSQDHAAALAAAVVAVFVVATYVWYVSVGHWTGWPKTSSYYQQLADAFRAGQVSLLEKPDPKLLNLADPYELANRQNVAYPWDVVFYHGQFFLYWGPVPALVLNGIESVYRGEIDDQVLVFLFVTGAFLFSSLFLLRLRSRFFSHLKWPAILPAIVMAGLANPLPWLLNRPAVYEAAIASGQCFLIAGLYFAFSAAARPRPGYFRLALSGLALALAVASRASLAPAAAFLAALTAVFLLWRTGRRGAKLAGTAAVGLPFAAGILAQGWYNFVRFGSWLEFGFKYQLTGMDTHIQTFSLANLAVNLHNYLLNPYQVQAAFPFVTPNLGGHFIFFVISSPANYYTEQVSGLLVTVPFLLLAGLPVFYLLRRAWLGLRGRAETIPPIADLNGDRLFLWTALALSIGTLLAFAPILLFISATMRYLGDVVPLAVLLASLGFWLGLEFLSGRCAARGWFVAAVIGLTLFSAIVSLLLAVTGAEARFEHLNPVLFEQLSRWLTP